MLRQEIGLGSKARGPCRGLAGPKSRPPLFSCESTHEKFHTKYLAYFKRFHTYWMSIFAIPMGENPSRRTHGGGEGGCARGSPHHLPPHSLGQPGKAPRTSPPGGPHHQPLARHQPDKPACHPPECEGRQLLAHVCSNLFQDVLHKVELSYFF